MPREGQISQVSIGKDGRSDRGSDRADPGQDRSRPPVRHTPLAIVRATPRCADPSAAWAPSLESRPKGPDWGRVGNTQDIG
eukprot:2597845-Alexandrium_andersonii.AAC.1